MQFKDDILNSYCRIGIGLILGRLKFSAKVWDECPSKIIRNLDIYGFVTIIKGLWKHHADHTSPSYWLNDLSPVF